MPPARPAELDALLRCLSGHSQANMNWQAVIAAANRTLTTAVLAERAGDDLPEDVAQFLATILDRTTARNARLLEQLKEAAKCLNSCGVRPIVLKGAAIQADIGDHYRGRILSDLDLMIPSSSSARASACLQNAGYLRQEGSGAADQPAVLYRPQDVGMIDLHIRTKAARPHFTFEMLIDHCSSLRLGNAELWLPSRTFQAVILILHDQLQERDYWRGFIDLRHLLDMQALARSPPCHDEAGEIGSAIDWPQLLTQFPPGAPRRAAQLQMLTAKNLLGLSIPEHLCGSRWIRAQYRRRIMQLRWPALMPMATLLTVALDPFVGLIPERLPSTPVSQSGRTSRSGSFADHLEARNASAGMAHTPWRLKRIKAAIRRFTRPKNPGKL